MRRKSKITAIITYVLSIVLIVGLVVGNFYAMSYSQIISIYLGHDTSKTVSNDENVDSQYYKSSFSTEEEMRKYTEEISQKIEEEGIVLLKNDNNALPLASGGKVSLLGQSSVDLVYGGVGAGSVDSSEAPNLLDAMKASGFDVNMTLWDFYKSGAGSSYRKAVPDVYGQGSFAVNEVPANVYTDEVKNSFKEYNDAAVVVIGRSGGETADISSEVLESGSLYLEVDKNERELLQMASDNFDKVVVVINASNAMELDFLNEYDIDACIWVGAVGERGAYAIGEVLNGNVNPSGNLVNTYAYNVMGSPAMANLGNYQIANSNVVNGNTYMVYAEGIYVGYRYYETRYEDVVLGNEKLENYDYSKEVQFPFGYGLSYTNFEWSEYTVKEKENEFEISVKVINKGDVAGKDVVQIYMQSPYTEYDKENDIEKSSVELVGFEKTSLIEPGKSEVITVTVDKEDMKTYDAKGYGTYIVDAGDYYFTAGENSHDALNNILAAKGYSKADGMDYEGNAELTNKVTVENLDSKTYAVSVATGNEISNQFEDVDINYYDPSFKYLSRKDWTGTWPTTYAGGSMTASDQMLKDLEISHTEDPEAVMPETGKISNEYGKLSAAMFIGLDYNDEMWDVLLDQLTIEEMTKLVRMGGYATVPIESINLPGTIDKDGPAGISSTLVGGGTKCMSYPAQVVMGSTWNLDLIEEMGKAIGEDSLNSKVAGWYAPGINIHRAPFSGRNFEYFAEDSFLSGKMAGSEVKGVQSMGAFVFMKHFALNDQETNRMGGAIFANEQTVRELYLTPFEGAVRDGDARGAMASMNRIGARWSGGHAGLMTETLRNEWGFEGTVITDQASYSVFAYQDILEGLEAGTNLWLNTDSSLWELSGNTLTPTVVNNIRESVHSIIYTIVNSHAMNGLSVDSKIVSVTPLWKYWLYALDAVVAIGVVVSVTIVTKKLLREKKENRQTVK